MTDFAAEVRDDGSGVLEIVAEVVTALPEGATVRVVFTPQSGQAKVRKARIGLDGRGTATYRGCPPGGVRVCVEGCGETWCRQVGCP